jgi:hypothetical protein
MSQNGQNSQLSEKDKEQYERSWTENMVKYWRERMMLLKPPVFDTGNLYYSVKGTIGLGKNTTIEHKFAEYGIYVAAGTGNGYRRGNSGKDDENGLQFLRGGKWKKGRGHRKRRDWFSKKYLYSLHRLNDFEAEYYGETYQGLLAGALSAMFGDPTASVKSNNGKTGATGALGNL